MKKLIFGILFVAANTVNAGLTKINSIVHCLQAYGEPWYGVAIAGDNSKTKAFIIYHNRTMTLLASPDVSMSVDKNLTIYRDGNGQFELKTLYNQYTGELSATLFASAGLFSSTKPHKHNFDLRFRELKCYRDVTVHYSHVLK